MQREAAYTNLADWFEYLNDDCDYENWSQYLISRLEGYALKQGLDLGCGGGYFTRALQKHGYEMTGMDASGEMLDYAGRKALETGVRSTYVLGDITKNKPPKRYDFITAINDCINYIPKTKLRAALKNVYGALQNGGVFFFDVSSPYKFEKKIANTVSADDRDEITYLAFNRVDGEKATLDVTLFVRQKNGDYKRFDETHTQYIYTEKELTDALEEQGFSVVKTEGHMGEPIENSDRICILAQKGSKK